MKLLVAAAGKLRRGAEADLVADFTDRIRKTGRNIGFTDFDIVEIEAPKALAGAPRQAREGELLRAAAGAATFTLALDEHGQALSSEAFASELGRLRDTSAGGAAFLIGGADGHDPALLRSADMKLSLGPMTWPHMLARVMLCEQIYRAMTILSGHPYHRQ